MNPTEATASVRILNLVAHADSVVDDDERRAIAHVADEAGAPRDEPGAIDLEAELARLTSEEAKRLTMRAALAVATIDGKCTPEEHRVLEKLDAAIGDEGDLEAEEITWMARMGDVRSELGEATDGFLHEVARASSEADLSAQRYLALVASLERKKRAVIARAIG